MFLKKKEINLVFKKGFFFYNKKIKIFFLNKKNLNYSKISIIIPKKKIKKSVDRNKIKRRIFNSYKINEKKFFLKKKYFIIFYYFNNKILNYKKINENIKNILLNIKNEKKNYYRFRQSKKKI